MAPRMAVTVIVSLFSNMAVGFVVGLGVHHGIRLVARRAD